MAVANRPLKRRRRTAQRGKPMTQSQRWGKVVTTMTPVPQGVISTSTGPSEPTLEEAIVEADAEEAEPSEFDPDMDDPYEDQA